MNLDNFQKRRRPSSDDGAAEYDFTQIAQNAVSDMRVQQEVNDAWWDMDEDLSLDSSSLDASSSEPNEKKRKGFSRGFGKKNAASPDPWDQPRDRSSITDGSEPARQHKGFGFGKGKRSDASSHEDAFSVDSTSAEGSPKRKGFGFAGKKQTKPDDIDSLNPSSTEAAGSRHGFSRRKSAAAPQPASIADDWDIPVTPQQTDTVPVPPSVPPTPAAPTAPAANSSAQPERRVFNAATQPNYSYMTDYPEEDAPRRPADPSERAGMIGVIKNNIRSKLGKDEPGVTYYTPPAGHVPSQMRRHQKRRNRRPLRAWTKALLFALGMFAAFSLILYIAFYTIITGRINYVGNSVKNPVYLSVEEFANLSADLTDTEENAAEFTEPLSFVEPGQDVKVILVVSSDNRIGDTFDSNGRKRTNNSAKTDSIMLVAIDHANRRIRVASIMTDTYVRIQDYKTNKLSKAYYYDTANGDYTLPCLRQVIHDNFGITPDNYVVVDFRAFQVLVNRLGGLDINVSADEAYYMSAHERYGDFPRFNSAGTYRMSGPEALNYVRMRAVGNDDYDRCARQRIVFRQMLTQINDMSKLELAELAYALLPELPTDMSASQLFDYFSAASDISSYEINEVTFPITNSWRYGTASVRDEVDEPEATPVVSSSDVVSGSDLTVTEKPVDPRSTKFTVIVTNFQFNANALQKFLYENDDSYLNGTAANGISVPEIIAPLEADSPAAGLQPAA